MRYLILGLGIYGSNLALDLTDMGHEVIGADIRKANVDAIKDNISTVYHIDATEETSLSMLPLNNVDLVIVAIGENFGASIKVVAMLKKLKVKHIYARAIDTLHESILQSFEIDRILTPEQRAANDLTNEMGLGSRVQSLKVDEENYVLKFKMPQQLLGHKYSDLKFEETYKIRIMAVTRDFEASNLIGIKRMEARMIDFNAPGETVTAGDTATCMGSKRGFTSLYKLLGAI